MSATYLLKQLTGSLVFFLVLFIAAGRPDYWQGWVYVAIGLVMLVLSYTLLKPCKELLVERSKPGAGAKVWDKKILGLSLLSTIAMYIVAGLDSGRFRWSPYVHPALGVTGILLTITGQLLFLIAQKQNRFFSSTMRIQTDRQHVVCETGLYKWVRHPAYLGSTIQALGFPLLMGSLWSFLPVIFMIVLLITRTALEDNTLLRELTGYPAYAAKTRYRLIPGLW